MFVQQNYLRSRLKCLEAALCGNRCRDGRVRRETSVLHCLRRPAQQLVLAMAKGEERGGGLTAEEFFQSVLQRQRAGAGASARGVGEPHNGGRAAEGVSEELRAEVQRKLQQQALLAEREAAGGTLQQEEADQGTSGQADPRQGYEERERARAERRQQGMQEYAADSLVPQTLAAMAVDVEFQRVARQLREQGQAALTAHERRRRRRALDQLGVPNFTNFIASHGAAVPLRRHEVGTLQVNIGLYCNQACAHCHVESSPLRTEMMDQRTAQRLVALLERSPSVHTVDITGGAPELNSHFRYLVREARRLGREVLDRCNLTVLLEPGQEDLAQFLADQRVHIVASLPCYSAGNVDKQRGRGVFERSIAALKLLNTLGYGQEGSGLQLDLVYNPVGASLPPPQASLEAAYKKELWDTFGISFNHLFTITNMPIKRFADQLHREGGLQAYMDVLVSSFNPSAVANVMCTNLISVRWDGALFDCDFNQQLALGVPAGVGRTIFEIEALEDLVGAPVACDNHCFGCTAGQGSSCTGVVA